MRSREVVGLVVLLGQVAAGGWAETAAAPATNSKPVKLGYKYRTGAVTRMRFSSNGTIIVDISHLLPHAPGLLGAAVTVDVTGQYDVIQTVKSVNAEGSGTLDYKLDNLTMRATVMDSAMVVKYANGKASFFKEGMAITPPGLGKGDPFAGRHFEARVSSRGKVLNQQGSLLETMKRVFAGYDEFSVFQPVFLMPEVALLVFPPGEQSVGESWPDEVLGADVSHIITKDGKSQPTESIKATTTFTALQPRGARQIAVLELKAERAAPPSNDNRITGTRSDNAGAPRLVLTGTHLLDVTGGQLKMSEYTAKISARDEDDAMPGHVAAAIGIDANMYYKLAFIAMPDAKPAPATKPGKKGAPKENPRYRGRGSTYSRLPSATPGAL